MYTQETRAEIPDIVAEWNPICDSTNLEMQNETLTENNVSAEMDESFDITDRNIDPVTPIVESSIHDVLTESVIEDGPVKYCILEGGSQRRTKVLISSLGYAYGIKRENEESMIWRCTSRSKQVKCPVILKQNGDAFVQKNDHLHPACTDRELKMNVYSKVRTTSCNQVYRPAMAIVEEAVLEFHRPHNTAHLKKKLLKRVANRARASLRPEEPKTLDFEIDRHFLDAYEFVISDIQYDGHRHITFMTSEQMELLKSAKRWYMDGTFKVVGEPFKRQGQFMSIHAFVERNGQSKQVPLVFSLMSRRTKEDYIMVLRSIQQKIGMHCLEGFVLDYEQGAWQAVREVFPAVQIKGCAFHWSQAIWRHVQQLGLAETYRQRLGLHSFIRMLLALQFLPSPHIERAFEMLAERAKTTATTALIDYVRRQWMNNPTFGVDDWSVFRQSIRTNNDVEGWHHRLNKKAGSSCLSFYKLFPLSRQEAELVKITIDSNDVERETSTRSKRMDRLINACWDRYSSGEMGRHLDSCRALVKQTQDKAIFNNLSEKNMSRYQKGILGVKKDPKNQILFSFSVRDGEEWPSDDDDSDYKPYDSSDAEEDDRKQNRKQKSKNGKKAVKKQKIEHVSNEEEKLKNICKKPNEGGIPPLPVEIWETIFEYVTQQEGAVPFLLKVAPAVCKLWKQISKKSRLWKVVDLSFGWIKMSDSSFQKLCRKQLTDCMELNLTGSKLTAKLDNIKAIAENCSQLTRINLTRCNKLPQDSVNILLKGCKRLSDIDLTGTTADCVSQQTLSNMATTCSVRLKRLVIANNQVKAFSVAFNAIMDNCPNLQHLDLSNINFSSTLSIDIEKFQTCCPNLKILGLANTSWRATSITQRAMGLCPGFPNLEEISLAVVSDGSSSAVTGQVVERLLKDASKLHLVDLRGKHSGVLSGLLNIKAGNLEQLYLSRIETLNCVDLPDVIHKWRHSLTDLDLSWNNFRGEILQNVITVLCEGDVPCALKNFNLAGTCVSMEMVRKLLKHLPYLQTLDLTSCRDVSRGCKREYKSKKDLLSLKRMLK